MPRYTYTCEPCGSTTIHDAPVKDRHTLAPTCAQCGIQMTLTVTPVGMSFKGQGWTPKFGPL